MKHLLLTSFALLFFVTGCLTTEFKEISLHISEDGSGNGEIVYKNLLSQRYSEEDSPEKDFDNLVSEYIDGNLFEQEFPNLKIKSKKLYLENDKLNGKIEFDFNNISDLNFFKFNNESPIMYHLKSVDETFVESNGFYNEDIMPVVFWENSVKHLTLKTLISGEIIPEKDEFISLKDEFLKREKK